MSNNATLWIVIALVAVAVVAVIAAASASRRRNRLRSAELRQRFGPEYDRAVQDFGGPARAERELAAREQRVERIHIRELSAGDRARFATAWSSLQAQFVDDPSAAVAGANALIKDVMRTRGYPVDDFDQRVADLSVDHAAVVQHYRAARALSASSGTVATEDLRQAVVHFRALFADLLEEAGSPSQVLRERHA